MEPILGIFLALLSFVLIALLIAGLGVMIALSRGNYKP